VSAAIKVPPAVKRAHGLPSTDMEVRSSWAMQGGKIGLWLIERDRGETGRVWPVPGVDLEDAKMWMEAARGS
jgi:hypothetical protein